MFWRVFILHNAILYFSKKCVKMSISCIYIFGGNLRAFKITQAMETDIFILKYLLTVSITYCGGHPNLGLWRNIFKVKKIVLCSINFNQSHIKRMSTPC